MDLDFTKTYPFCSFSLDLVYSEYLSFMILHKVRAVDNLTIFPLRISLRMQRIFTALFWLLSGSHSEEPIAQDDTKSETRRLRCCVCSSLTSYKFSKCSRPGKVQAFCQAITGWSCWNDIHGLR